MPQLEKGYLKIANEIVDALAGIRISGEEMQCLWVILRKTYGWNKKEDRIALSQFVEATGLQKPYVSRALNKLLQKNIIIKKDNRNGLMYGFQKNYRKWNPLSKKMTSYIKTPTLRPFCYVCEFNKALEKHHIKPKSEGGSDRVENLINLCPNCHALVHKGEIEKKDLLSKKIIHEKDIKKDNPLEKDIKKDNPLEKDIKKDNPLEKDVLSKKIHTKENTKDTITKENIYSVFDFWNKQEITKHRTIDKSKSSINASLKEYSEDEIIGAIANYKKILEDPNYYWTHKWTLKEFLQRGMDKFRDENNPYDNYKADKKRGTRSGKYTGLDDKDYSEGIGEDGSF